MEIKNRTEIITVIKNKRIELNMSQQRLAELSETNKADISNIEACKKNITTDKLLIVLKALDLTLDISDYLTAVPVPKSKGKKEAPKRFNLAEELSKIKNKG